MRGGSGARSVRNVPGQRANDSFNLRQFIGLRQERVHVPPLGPIDLNGARIPGYEDDWKVRAHGFHKPSHGPARQARHVEVRHYQIHRLLPEDRETDRPALGLCHRVAECLEHVPNRLSAGRIIVNDQGGVAEYSRNPRDLT
jgi:hypothetical protein